MQFLKRIPEGFIYGLAYSKMNPAGTEQPENHKPVLGAAAIALDAWLHASGITSAVIFRSVRKGGPLGDSR